MRISALPAGTAPTGVEVLPAVQGGQTVGLTIAQLVTKSDPGFVRPEDFGAVGDAVADDTAAIQAAVAYCAANDVNLYLASLYLISSTITLPFGFAGHSIIGASNGAVGLYATTNITHLEINSGAGVTDRITLSNFILLNSGSVTSSEVGVRFAGANYIQHCTFDKLRFYNIHTGFLDTTASKVNWCLFCEIQVMQASNYGYRSTKGSGTGNIFDAWTAIIATACVDIGDNTTDVGDLIFSNMHIGGTGASGIVLRGGVSYGHLVAVNGCQFDAGLTYGLDFTGMQRISGGGNNWGGSVENRFTTCYSININQCYIVTPTQIASDQNNYSPTDLANARALRLSTDASRNITGIAKGWDGRELRLINAGAFDVVLINQSGSSSNGNKFYFNGVNITLQPGQIFNLAYEGVNAVWMGR